MKQVIIFAVLLVVNVYLAVIVAGAYIYHKQSLKKAGEVQSQPVSDQPSSVAEAEPVAAVETPIIVANAVDEWSIYDKPTTFRKPKYKYISKTKKLISTEVKKEADEGVLAALIA